MRARAKEMIMAVALVALLAAVGGSILRGGRPAVDTTDYRAVAEGFITANAIIARKIGKIEHLDHFGEGGEGGDVSYNVFRLTGSEASAVCHLTLRRTDRVNWKVETAILTFKGTDYRIPTRKADPGGRFRLF